MRPRPRVLFVGDDASSPEIAASLLRRLVGDRVEVVTAGAQRPDPGGRGDDILVQMGLNPAAEERLGTAALSVADRVVVLGAGLDVARVAGRRYEEWDMSREDLAERVRLLSVELLRPEAPAEDRGVRRLRAHLARVARRAGRAAERLWSVLHRRRGDG